MATPRILAVKPTFDPRASESLVERRGGLLLSIFFHLMLLALLFNHETSRPAATESPSPVFLSLAPPPPPAQPAPIPFADEPLLDEVRRTSDVGEQRDLAARDSTDLERIFRPAQPETPAEQPASPPPAEIETPDRAEDPERKRPPVLDEETRKLMEAFNDLAVAQIEQQIIAKADLQGRIFEEQEDIRTANADYVSSGATEGHIRELDISDVPIVIIRHVLGRYGAELGTRPLRPEEIGPNSPHTLNAARVGDHILTAGEGDGDGGLWIQYGDILSARLLDLERLAMARRGLNPGRVALTKTVFTIDRSPTSGWVLKVRDMDYIEVD